VPTKLHVAALAQIVALPHSASSSEGTSKWFVARDYVTIDIVAMRILEGIRIDEQLDLLLRIFVVVRPLHKSRNITWPRRRKRLLRQRRGLCVVNIPRLM
jgi:hypothetical protein